MAFYAMPNGVAIKPLQGYQWVVLEVFFCQNKATRPAECLGAREYLRAAEMALRCVSMSTREVKKQKSQSS